MRENIEKINKLRVHLSEVCCEDRKSFVKICQFVGFEARHFKLDQGIQNLMRFNLVNASVVDFSKNRTFSLMWESKMTAFWVKISYDGQKSKIF